MLAGQPQVILQIEALTIAIIITASQSDKYKTNITFFLPLLQLPTRDLSLTAPSLCLLGCICVARR